MDAAVSVVNLKMAVPWTQPVIWGCQKDRIEAGEC